MKGDVVLVEGKGFGASAVKLSNWWTRLFKKKDPAIKYSHCGVMVSETEIVEALGNGVKKREFPYKKHYMIYRKKSLNNIQRDDMNKEAHSFVNQKYSYKLIALLSVMKLFRLEEIIKLNLPFKKKICSLVVAKCYNVPSVNYNFRPSESIIFVDPADIAEMIMVTDKDSWDLVEKG
jgi:hypothetical protein